ncbi:Elongation factor Ts, mitochondrial [Orchesella cincta]|uniref:Elongation factor Ts, mitochondrial n=1 Tax=Orchesella cincta TaxID=48709 RepID=A0A1D2N6B5_ORCCI|nr:Elongation factor Ts, mitochondrial [Orchesella cincta]
MSLLLTRYFHTSRLWNAAATAASAKPVEKSALAKLRRVTGYSFSKCKEALEKNGNDVKEAESWLRSQAQTHGWEKATKLQGRATAQGLVSILSSQHNAVMMEVNCETDFVARNKKFQSLVQKITSGCYTYSKGQAGAVDTILSKVSMSTDEVGSIPLDGSRSMKDEVAVNIGELGENIKLRRAVALGSGTSILLAGYTHPAAAEGSVLGKDVVQVGKFGAIVAYKSTEPSGKGISSGRMAEIGRQLCQHIVGMNPKEVGSLDAPPPKAVTLYATPPVVKTETDTPASASQEAPSEEKNNEEEFEYVAKSKSDVDETILVNQEFLLDPDLTVRDFLVQNSIEVVDFVRFECGEEVETTPAA